MSGTRRASLAPMVTDSFFTVNAEKLRETVSEMPWVAAVNVQKRWPDTVQVTIREHAPVAHWVNGYLLDAEGERFMVPYADEIQGMPWLEGPETQLDIVFENWQKFDDRLVSIGQQIEHLTLDPRGSWSARLSGGTAIRLGKGEIFENLDTLVSTWDGLMHGKSVPPVSVDLRYTNGFAVLWPQNLDAIVGTYGEES